MGNLYPALRRLLEDAGCTLLRSPPGSHEIWASPITGKRFAVPRNTRVRHTANGILKTAGLPKHF